MLELLAALLLLLATLLLLLATLLELDDVAVVDVQTIVVMLLAGRLAGTVLLNVALFGLPSPSIDCTTLDTLYPFTPLIASDDTAVVSFTFTSTATMESPRASV